MNRSAEAKWNGTAARWIGRVHEALHRLKVAARTRGGSASSRHMVLLESLSLGNRRQLFLVACGDHRFLVGASADRVGTVVAMPAGQPDAALLQVASQQHPPNRAGTGYQRPGSMRERSVGISGLQLVKRDDALRVEGIEDHGVETGRSQWS